MIKADVIFITESLVTIRTISPVEGFMLTGFLRYDPGDPGGREKALNAILEDLFAKYDAFSEHRGEILVMLDESGYYVLKELQDEEMERLRFRAEECDDGSRESWDAKVEYHVKDMRLSPSMDEHVLEELLQNVERICGCSIGKELFLQFLSTGKN